MTRGIIKAALAALALGGFCMPGFAATALNDGANTTVTLSPGEVNNEFFVDVPQGTTHMTLMLESAPPNIEDVDMFLRFGESFSANQNLYPQSRYWSVGDTGVEFLNITYASSPPVSPGRWYIALLNNENELTADVELTVDLKAEAVPTLKPLEIQVVYTDRNNFGFNDNSPFPGQGGNTENTLGKARKAAFKKAIEILEESFSSPVPIVIDAHFEKIPEDENGGTALASAGPNFIAFNFPGTQVAGTWYPSSTVPRLAGTDYCRVFKDDSGRTCSDSPVAELSIQFNTESDWWYGFERDFFENGYDFIAVSLHEILHGLGFLSLVNVETGQKCCDLTERRRDDIFSENLVYEINGKEKPFNELTNAGRRRALTSQRKLVWDGPLGNQWDEETLGGREIIYSPNSPNPGSTGSHTGFLDLMYWSGAGPTQQDRVNIRQSGPELGAAWYFLRDSGWDESPKEPLGNGGGDNGPSIARGLYFDPARNGHGFDFQRRGDDYFLLFYTYDDNGEPEWYLAVVKETSPNVFSGDLDYVTYDTSDPDGTPQDGETVGTVTVDFTATASTPACDDGFERPAAVELAQFSWTINETSGDWCVYPLLVGSPPNPDFTGSWFATDTDDVGWGMTISHGVHGNKEILVDTLYYYDAEGNPRWAQGSTGDFTNDAVIEMNEFDGYARNTDCSAGCNAANLQKAGTLSLTLVEASRNEAGNSASMNVTYQGQEGGDWNRTDASIQLLSDPAP